MLIDCVLWRIQLKRGYPNPTAIYHHPASGFASFSATKILMNEITDRKVVLKSSGVDNI